MANPSDVVAHWKLPLPDGVHLIQFEHGTTSGKRVIWVDGKDIHRKEWMFKLVGKETFAVGKTTCTISIEAVNGFEYEYSIEVNGKSFDKFKQNQVKIMKAWNVMIGGECKRICLEKDSLNIWLDDKLLECQGEFQEDGDGVETHFQINERYAGRIVATRVGKHTKGLGRGRGAEIVHTLFINDDEMVESKE